MYITTFAARMGADSAGVLSRFRTQQWLDRLQTHHPDVNALHGQHQFLVATDQALSPAEQQRLGQLLDA